MVPVGLGGTCVVNAQCQANTMNSTCNPSNMTCVCQPHFNVNASGNGCLFDYAGYGFTSYNGRYVYHLVGGPTPSTWNYAFVFCTWIMSRMFIPRNSAEWDWMEQTTRTFLDTYVYFPINDKSNEGNPVWNNGTSEGKNGVMSERIGLL
nr:uncharacterized protein LOC128684625 [Cherax quadricarinatus]